MQTLQGSSSHNAASDTNSISAQGCIGGEEVSLASRRVPLTLSINHILSSSTFHWSHLTLTPSVGSSHISSLGEMISTHKLRAQDSPPTSHQSQVGRFNTLKALDGNIHTYTHGSPLDEVRLLTEQQINCQCRQNSIAILNCQEASNTQS